MGISRRVMGTGRVPWAVILAACVVSAAFGTEEATDDAAITTRRTGRHLLGKSSAFLRNSFKCDDPESQLTAVNFPEQTAGAGKGLFNDLAKKQFKETAKIVKENREKKKKKNDEKKRNKGKKRKENSRSPYKWVRDGYKLGFKEGFKGAAAVCKQPELGETSRAKRRKGKARRSAGRAKRRGKRRAGRAKRRGKRRANRAEKKKIKALPKHLRRNARKVRRKQKRAQHKAWKSWKKRKKKGKIGVLQKQTVCCKETRQCITFCHKKCPGFRIAGVGTIYAQYMAGNTRKNNQNQGAAKIRRIMKHYGYTKPCTSRVGSANNFFCKNNLEKVKKGDALFFNSKKPTMAANDKCALKWGFYRKTFRNQKNTGSGIARLGEASSSQARRSAKRQARKGKRIANRKRRKGKRVAKRKQRKNKKMMFRFDVDVMSATLCNTVTGKCAQRKVLVNCIKNRQNFGSKSQTWPCSTVEQLLYSEIM